MIFAIHHVAALLGALLTCAAMLYGKPWTRSHPRLSVGLWHLLGLTIGLSVFGLLISIALRTLGLGVAPALNVVGRGDQNVADLTATEIASLLGAALLAITTFMIYANLTLQRHRAQVRHRSLLSIVAESRSNSMTLINHEAIVVYALPGRDPQIVATSAAIRGLDALQLRAVLAHERHHLSARHHLAVLPFSMFRSVSRSVTLTAVENEIELLLEMCADDHAVREGHREGLIAAIDLFARRADASELPPVSDCGNTSVLAARRARLKQPPTRSGIVSALIGSVSALTLAATTISLYFLPV